MANTDDHNARRPDFSKLAETCSLHPECEAPSGSIHYCPHPQAAELAVHAEGRQCGCDPLGTHHCEDRPAAAAISTSAKHLLAGDLAPTCGDYTPAADGRLHLSPVIAEVSCRPCILAAAANSLEAAVRVTEYLAAYASMSNLDPQEIHTLWRGGEPFVLRVADLDALLAAVAIAGEVDL